MKKQWNKAINACQSRKDGQKKDVKMVKRRVKYSVKYGVKSQRKEGNQHTEKIEG